MSEMDFGKQVGPLPLGGWIVVVAGGLGIAYVVSRGQARNDAREEPLVEPGVGTGLVPAGAVIVQPETDDTTPDDNQAWSVRAVNYLIGLGTDATTAQQAIAKYLAGEPLTVQEKALVNLALVRFGATPEPVPPATEGPQTPPAQAPARDSISLNSVPKTVKAGSSIIISGTVKLAGKTNHRTTVRVELDRPNLDRIPFRGGLPHARVTSDSTGAFRFIYRTYRSTATPRRYRFRTEGPTASAYATTGNITITK